MKRSFPLLVLALLLCFACSSSKSRSTTGFRSFDPPQDPGVVGTVDDEAQQAAEGALAGAKTGRRIGRVAGVIAAIFGGPSHESLDDTIDRYRRTRDAAEVAGAIVGATGAVIASGVLDEAEPCLELDELFAQLQHIEGLVVTHPTAGQIDVRLQRDNYQFLERIAAVLAGSAQLAILIEGPDDSALAVRESLIDLGVPSSTLSAHRSNSSSEVVLHIRLLR